MPRKYQSLSIFSTAWCPLNCKYCYIPKTPAMVEMHADIVRNLARDGIAEYLRFLDDGAAQTSVQLWGAEPMVSLRNVIPHLPTLSKKYNVRRIFFSTSLILDPSVIIDFVRAADAAGINVGIQVSLDGPPEITDETRGPGIADKVVENLKWLFQQVSEVCPAVKVSFLFKPTWTASELMKFSEDPTFLDRFVGFFRALVSDLKDLATCENVRPPHVPLPTFEMPGNYLPEHGRAYAALIRRLGRRYMPVLRTALANNALLSGKPPGCRAGYTFVGSTGGMITLCHRFFFLLDDRYVRSLPTVRQNYDVDRVKDGFVDHVRQHYSARSDDLLGVLQFQRRILSYYSFISTRIAASAAVIRTLARSGLVLGKYWERRHAYRLAHTVWAVDGCPAEAILQTGIPYALSSSVFILFGNGAEDEIWRFLNG